MRKSRLSNRLQSATPTLVYPDAFTSASNLNIATNLRTNKSREGKCLFLIQLDFLIKLIFK